MPAENIPYMPIYTKESNPFWKACEKKEFILPFCNDCKKFFYPANIICPHCLSENIAWETAPTTGKLYSFTVFHKAFTQQLEQSVPYVVGSVQLAENVLFSCNIVNCDANKLFVEQNLKLVFINKLDSEIIMPCFEPEKN